MNILLVGGTGFVGLNIAEALLARGHAVTLFDRAAPPPAARQRLAAHGNKLKTVPGDVLDREATADLIATGFDTIVLGAAITVDAETPTVDLHSDADRAPLSVARLASEFGWRARFGCADSAEHFNAWSSRHREGH
jgi:nucleoside-diphosphate-sugar epimerase